MNAERHLRVVPDGPEPGRDAVAPAAGAPSAASSPFVGPDGRADLDALLVAVARGSAAAFERLYDSVADAVFGVARRVIRDVEMAQEVAQEALVEVWTQSQRFDRKAGSARAWILTIAHRRAVDRVRSEQAHQDRIARHARPLLPVDDQAEVVERAYAEWERARVTAGMERLTELQREALELAYWGGLTHREVSETLGVPLGTAKARLRDGIARLRDEMGVQS